MLIESQPQQSTTPPTPQLGLSQSMSSPSPQSTYVVFDRLKKRVEGYRLHHEISFDKNQNTIEAQNVKMKTETTRLQQQFLNNNQNNTTNNNKSKQQKSVNSSAAQRNANKRTNALANNSDSKCDSSESKPTKVAKVANNRNSANSAAKASQSSPNNQTFRSNCAKFTPNPQSIQIDVKMKTSMESSSISNANTQPLMHSNPSINSIPEIKREIDDNSYFRSVTVEAIHDFLKDNSSTINGFPPNNFDCISADDIKDYIFNDSNLVEDGFGAANDGFGDEDFIKKFLEDINESTFNEIGNLGQHLNTTFNSQQPVVNHSNNMINGENNTNNGLNCNNISINLLNNNLNINSNSNNMIINTNAMNSNNFIANSMQTPTHNEMTSYHPIQPRLQPNLMSNIPNRSTIQIMNASTQPIAINHNTTIRYVNSGNSPSQVGAPQQLLLQQMPVMSQQTINNAGMASIQSQQTSHHLIQQNSQQIHLRIPTGPSQQRMAMLSTVPKTEDVSVQLSIQVPQQTTQMMSNTTTAQPQVQQTNAQSVAAAAKLKQMAQHVQQKTHSHQWVINHSNPNLNQNTIQPMNQQMAQQMRPQTNQTVVSNQRITAQTQQLRQPQQVLSPDTQNANQNQMHPNQNQTYFASQMNQQIYWQHNQHNQQQQQQQQAKQHNPQHNPQQSQQQHHPQQQIQPQQSQSQTQQTSPQQLLQQNLQQTQQNFANYWSHPSQMGGQPSQPPQQQQTQHYFNNNNNSNNYNYFG